MSRRVGFVACVLAWGLLIGISYTAQPWPFTPKGARLVMLMDKGRPAKTNDGRQLWALSADLSYRTHAGDTIAVPKGMVTDLASIPRLVQGLLPSDGAYAQAALIHDGCYRSRGGYVWRRKVGDFHGLHRQRPLTRPECDQLLDEAMADLGIGWPTRWTIWSAVRFGGAGGWGR